MKESNKKLLLDELLEIYQYLKNLSEIRYFVNEFIPAGNVFRLGTPSDAVLVMNDDTASAFNTASK